MRRLNLARCDQPSARFERSLPVHRPVSARSTPPSFYESLESRRLLSGVFDSESDPTRLVREQIFRATGLTEAVASQIVSARDVDASSFAGLSIGQTGYWSALSRRSAERVSSTLSVAKLDVFALDQRSIARALNRAMGEGVVKTRAEMSTLMLPTPDGGVARFGIERYDLLAPHVAAQFPEIKSVRLYGLDDASAVGTATLTSTGLSAFVSSPNGDWHVSPLDARVSGLAHASYFHAHQFSKKPEGGHGGGCMCSECLGMGGAIEAGLMNTGGSEANPDALINLGQTRRTYRFAFGVTGQFTTALGSVTAAFNNIVTRIGVANAVFLRDLNVQLTIVSDTRTVFADPFNDGYNNSNPVDMSIENEAILNNAYGVGAYDIGHALGQIAGISGVSLGLSTVGGADKAKAASTANFSSPDYNVVLFHEIGHQLGAPHTFNNADGPQRSAGTAYEPGPGSTIMSYGSAELGYSGSFVTFNDLYFHHNSIDRIENFLLTIPTVGTSTTQTNRVPVANAGPDRTIPANTYFELTGQAYDDQHNALTYTWEQYDLGPEVAIGTNANTGTGPLFRSREMEQDPTRTFGELADILAGRVDVDESLPLVNRTVDPLTFRLTVRDQLGGVSDDVINLPVVATGAPFVITSQNTAGTIWAAGSSQTVTWNVAGTTANGINTPNVDIFLSYDAGVTFTPVALGVPNDGSQAITVPVDARASTTARVKVKGAGNYFFDINNAPITITGIAPLNGLPVVAPASELPLYASRTGELRDAQLPLMNGASPNIDFAGDTDTYLFSPAITTEYLITTGRVGATSVDTVLSVYDDLTGVPLAINDDFGGGTATSQVSLFMEAGKRYRISIGEFQSNNTGDVFLNVIAGNTAPVASTIALNANGDGSTSNSLISSRESKFHQFTVPTRYDGTGSITLTAPEASTVFSLYNAADDLIAFTQSGTFTNLSALVAGQTYTLRVGTQNYASGGGAYTININLDVLPLPETLTVAEGTIAIHSPTRTSFDAHSPDVWIVSPNEVDARYFAPVATGLSPRGGTVRVTGGTLNPAVGIYNATTGARVALATGTGVGSTAEITNFAFLAGVRYIIAVSGLGDTTGNPDVRVTMETFTQLPQSDVTLNGLGDGSAAFNFVANSLGQSFRIVTPANATGFVNFQADPDAASDVELYLFDNAGNELAVNQAGGPDVVEGIAQLFVPPGTVFFATILSQNYAGGSATRTGVFNVNFDTPTAPAAPTTAPILRPEDDSGPFNNDGITNNPDGALSIRTFTSGPAQGRFVRLYRDGVLVAGPNEVPAGFADLTLNDSATLADGTYVYTSTAANTATGPESGFSPPTFIIVDRSSPVFTGFQFRFDGNTDHNFFIDFDSSLQGFAASDIVVTNTTTGQVIPSSDFNLVVNTAGPGLNDYIYNPTAGSDRLPSGNYTLTLAAGVATDIAGNANQVVAPTFFFQDGDANRDRRVDFTDLLILARNYNQTGKFFSEGNFDLSVDGLVGFSDLLILARNYNVTLPSQVFGSTAIAFATPTTTRSVREDVL